MSLVFLPILVIYSFVHIPVVFFCPNDVRFKRVLKQRCQLIRFCCFSFLRSFPFFLEILLTYRTTSKGTSICCTVTIYLWITQRGALFLLGRGEKACFEWRFLGVNSWNALETWLQIHEKRTIHVFSGLAELYIIIHGLFLENLKETPK